MARQGVKGVVLLSLAALVLGIFTQVVWTGSDSDFVAVKRVIDGDTIELETGEKIRYIGIDTPETVHPSKPVECYGPEASIRNRELVEGERVRLEFDEDRIDGYKRTLAYIFLEDGTFVNAKLVEEGYARVCIYRPNDKYEELLRDLERKAQAENLGLWGACEGAGVLHCAPDVNFDGVVDFLDMMALTQHFGETIAEPQLPPDCWEELALFHEDIDNLEATIASKNAEILRLQAQIAQPLDTVPQPVEEPKYVASKKSDVFHRLSCGYVKNILKENKVFFATREEAIDAGKRPCRTCKP